MEINNRYFFFSIKKAEDCLFSRRNGHQGILLFGYSFFFIIKSIERRKADKRFNAGVIEPLAKKIQEEVDRQVLEEVVKYAKSKTEPTFISKNKFPEFKNIIGPKYPK